MWPKSEGFALRITNLALKLAKNSFVSENAEKVHSVMTALKKVYSPS